MCPHTKLMSHIVCERIRTLKAKVCFKINKITYAVLEGRFVYIVFVYLLQWSIFLLCWPRLTICPFPPLAALVLCCRFSAVIAHWVLRY